MADLEKEVIRTFKKDSGELVCEIFTDGSKKFYCEVTFSDLWSIFNDLTRDYANVVRFDKETHPFFDVSRESFDD